MWGAVRGALVPVASFGSNAAWILIFIGLFLRASASFGYTWCCSASLLYAAAVLFQLVTLPVEFDASRRAVASLQASGQYTPQQLTGVEQVLTAAALTYVAGALIAVLQLLYLIGLSRRRLALRVGVVR